MVLNVAKSRWAIPTQITFQIINVFGLLTGIIYNGKTPDLYPNNVHGSIGWVASLSAAAWMILSLTSLYTRSFNRSSGHKRTRSLGQPITAALMAQYRRVTASSPKPEDRRWSGDSGQGTERNSASLYDHSRSSSLQSDIQLDDENDASKEYGAEDDDVDSDATGREQRGLLRGMPGADRFLTRNVRKVTGFRGATFAISVATVVLDRMILILGFFGVTSGAVVYAGIFVSGIFSISEIFNFHNR